MANVILCVYVSSTHAEMFVKYCKQPQFTLLPIILHCTTILWMLPCSGCNRFRFDFVKKSKSKVILYYTNDKRTCLHTIYKLPRRTAHQVPARKPGITTGFSQAISCHTTALSGCNQPHEVYDPVDIHQSAPPSTRPVNKHTTHLSTPER